MTTEFWLYLHLLQKVTVVREMRGTCEVFCPENEAKLRIRERLLHFYEYKNGEKHVPGTLVTSFSRSAAGVKKPKARDMRTESSLQKTIEYLLKDIVLDKRKPFNIAYDFIFDRLRAVRQEVVMQEYNASQTIRLLEPMIMFLAYSRYRLCEEPIDNFDPKICDHHLLECLKRVLCCYDEIDNSKLTLAQLRNRNFIEALYQIFNLGSPEALRRCLTLPSDTRNDDIFELAFNIAMSYHQGNVYRVIVNITRLPHILCAIGALKLQEMRRKILEVFAHAYNSKQLSVPVDFVCRIAQCANSQHLYDVCKYYNVNFTADRASIQFAKTDFNVKAETMKPLHENFVEQKLKQMYLPEVLLLKRL